MKNFSKFKAMRSIAGVIAFVAVVGFSLTGCATSYVKSDPFNTGANSNRPIVRMTNTGAVKFDNSKGDSLKVNRVAIPTNEFSLPAAQSYEFKIRGKMVNTMPFVPDFKFLGRANITYNFVPGKTYYIVIAQTDESVAVNYIFGIATGVRVVLYDTEMKTRNKVAEFPIYEIEEKDW